MAIKITDPALTASDRAAREAKRTAKAEEQAERAKINEMLDTLDALRASLRGTEYNALTGNQQTDRLNSVLNESLKIQTAILKILKGLD
jgi:hypothetical protein